MHIETGLKREHSTCDEVTSKRQRILPGGSSKVHVNCHEKLTESQIQNLLDQIIDSTEEWTSQQLESLYTSLEVILERSENNTFAEMTECIESFLNNTKAYCKGDKN